MSHPERRVLLVEDDAQLAEMVQRLLSGEGYRVDTARDGQRALHLGLSRGYDVIVLDRGLPALEGLDVLGRLRAGGVTTPVLVLSALASAADRVTGLDAGAEDYLGKPFDVEELLARVRALLRRHLERSAVLPLPGGVLDVDRRLVRTTPGDEVLLSGREAALLEALARDPGRVISRDRLLSVAFPDAADPGVVDTYVHYVRRKLGRGSIVTVRGLGYRLGRP